MPTTQLKLGMGTLTLNGGGDLSSLATRFIDIKVVGGSLDFDTMLTKPIGQVPQFSAQAQIDFAQGESWKVAGQAEALTASIDAGVGGTLSLIAPGGTLFEFPKNADGSNGQVQTARKGNQDCPYLHISLTVKYSIDGGAQFSFGALGVNGSASVDRAFTVDNYFACDSSMLFADAVVAAFNAFALPFNAANASSIPDGAFLDYIFSGKIAFSAGVNYGFSLGAASLSQLQTSFDSSLVTAGLAPSVKVGPSMDVKFEADDAFRIIIGRVHSSPQNLLNVCVSKVDKKALGLDVGIHLSAGLGAQFDLQDTFNKLLGKATSALFAGLGDDAKTKALESLTKAIGAEAASKYINEAQTGIDEFLNKVNGEKADFTVSYERARTNTQLFNYTVNCDVPVALRDGYPAAIRCDFATAMKTDGVELQPGSFLDDELSKKTSITLQIFNVLSASDVTEFFQGLKTVYSGGGVFRLIFDTGMDWQSVFNGRSEDLKVFFEATAATNDQATFRNAAITLNFVMTDKKDSKSAALTAKVLRFLNDPELTALAGKIADTVQVSARVDTDACSALKFDAVRVDNRLNSGSHENDKRNYEAFAASVESIRPDDPFAHGLRRYEHWVTFNRSTTDQSGSTQPPNRADSGNLAVWPEEFIRISDPAVRQFIAIDFEAGRQFMNLCEFLERLNDETLDVSMTKPLFDKLLDSLSSAVGNSPTVLTWYSKACFAALAQLMSAKVTNVKGPAQPSDPAEISFELERQVSVPAVHS